MMNRVTVDILGERYTIRGEAEQKHISEVARLVDSRMRELRETGGTINKGRLAVLTAINLADELLQERLKEEPEDNKEVVRRTRQLITLLDEGLIGDTLQDS